MRRNFFLLLAAFLLAAPGPAEGKMDLVTLPARDAVQLTIYSSADLTLARDRRVLTMKKGLNQLQFSWANTLIDPTSLEMQPLAPGENIELLDLVFPPRTSQLGLWRLQSARGGRLPVEISYLTSGLSWRAFYLATLQGNETKMRLEGFVRVTNVSGEDYENAKVRLVVGQVHLLDRIADLAKRVPPYGRPGLAAGVPRPEAADAGLRRERAVEAKAALSQMQALEARPKEIVKEGLSEYFLYTIEGTETIPHGWSKRLPSFDSPEVPVANLYKYEEEQYGQAVVRFLSFKNDQAHGLGQTPIPGGLLKVYRHLDAAGHLSFEGQSQFKYIPVGEKIELNLGPVEDVLVRAKPMNFRTDRYLFDAEGDISGWDEIHEFEIEVKNTRAVPIQVEVRRHTPSAKWELTKKGAFGAYEQVDLSTVKFTLALKPGETRTFGYILTAHQGRRAD